MKYLFFDIECSNCFGGKGKICEFGYVLTDDKFNILIREDIPMNPGKSREFRFDKGIYKRDPNFKFAYDEDYYFSCDEFPKFYQKIKELIEGKDLLIFGYAVDNDIHYLDYTCRRYHLKPLDYIAYDTQKILKDFYYKNQKRNFKLLDAVSELCDKEEIQTIEPHLSCDDAKMTMMITREICHNLELEINDLISQNLNSKIDSLEFIQKCNEKKLQKKNNLNKKNDKNSNDSPSGKKMWKEFYHSKIELLDKIDSIGNLVTISNNLLSSAGSIEKIINKINEKGLVPISTISGSDYIIIENGEDEQRLLNIFRHPYNGKMLLMDDFLGVN